LNIFHDRLGDGTGSISFKSGLCFLFSDSGGRSHRSQHYVLLRHLWDNAVHPSSLQYILLRRLGDGEGLAQIGLNMKQERIRNGETIFVLIVVTAASELPRKP